MTESTRKMLEPFVAWFAARPASEALIWSILELVYSSARVDYLADELTKRYQGGDRAQP